MDGGDRLEGGRSGGRGGHGSGEEFGCSDGDAWTEEIRREALRGGLGYSDARSEGRRKTGDGSGRLRLQWIRRRGSELHGKSFDGLHGRRRGASRSTEQRLEGQQWVAGNLVAVGGTVATPVKGDGGVRWPFDWRIR